MPKPNIHSQIHQARHLLLLSFFSLCISATPLSQQFREAPEFYNSPECPSLSTSAADSLLCSEHAVHVAMTLDFAYIRGSMAAILSVLQHSACPQNVIFHFVAASNLPQLRSAISAAFPYLKVEIYPFGGL